MVPLMKFQILKIAMVGFTPMGRIFGGQAEPGEPISPGIPAGHRTVRFVLFIASYAKAYLGTLVPTYMFP